MRRWFIASNDYWFTAHIHLEKTPWYLVVLNDLVMHICGFIGRLDIPIPKKWEYYGNLGSVFHVFVCDPVSQFVWKKTEFIGISLPYFFLKERFPEEFELSESDWDDEPPLERFENKKLAAALDKRFNRAYNKVLDHENRVFKERGRK